MNIHTYYLSKNLILIYIKFIKYSKNQISGKVNRSIQYSAKRNEISKADRRNAAKIAQNKKRQEIININRLFSGTNGTPKIIVIVKKYLIYYYYFIVNFKIINYTN